MWAVAALCASYAGFAVLALAMPRHHRALVHREPGRAFKWVLRIIGAALLAAAFAACILAWGWSMGPVAWFGVLSAAAFTFVFLLSFALRTAAIFGVVLALAVGAGSAFVVVQ